MDDKARHERGLTQRRQVLGNAHVERSITARTEFNSEFQELITRYAWGEIWTRPHFDERTRRILVIGTTLALDKWEEFRLHVRAALAEGPQERSVAFETAFKELTGDTIPDTALITLELPEQAENGNIVPYTLTVESPMTEQDYVKTLHLLSTANPNSKVASFHFTPQSGLAKVTGRMRLAKTQDVICIAELSNGMKVMGTTRVEVALGGCLN